MLKLFKLLTDKDYRLYNRLVNKHKRKLIKQIRESAPFDYDALNIFVSFLRFMYDYYSKKHNVWAEEIEGHDRAEKIKYALDEFDAWDNCAYNHYKDLDDKYHPFLTDIEGEDFYKKNWDEIVRINEEIRVEEELHWNNFWNTIKDEFQFWWD